MVHSTDSAGRITSVNDHWLATLGYARRDVIGRPVSEFMAPKRMAAAWGRLGPAMGQPGRASNTEYRMFCRAGDTIDVLVSMLDRSDVGGQVVRSVAVVVNLSRWRHVERQAHRRGLRNRALSDVQGAMVCRFNRDLIMTFANEACARYFGRADLVGQSFLALFPRHVHNRVRHNIGALAPFRARSQVHEVLRPDGMLAWMQWHDIAVADGDRIVEYISVGRDITEIKRLEGAARIRQAFLSQVLEGMPDALAVFGRDGRLLVSNRHYREFHAPLRDLIDDGAGFEELLRRGLACHHFMPDDRPVHRWLDERLASYGGDGGSHELQLAGGRYLHERVSHTADGYVVCSSRDISDTKRMQARVREMALLDDLTGLPNRKAFRIELRRAIGRADRGGGGFALLLADLDEFKRINDTYGHPVGDALLAELGRRMRAAARQADVVSRLSGDEFALIVESEAPDGRFEGFIERLIEYVRQPIDDLAGEVIMPAVSIGYTVYPGDHHGAEDLIVHADSALYAAKRAGRDRAVRYAGGMDNGRIDSEGFESELDAAMRRGEFDLDYQPIFGLGTGRVIGVEALLRWNHPDRGRLTASEFMPRLEHDPIIVDVTAWVFARASIDLRRWRQLHGFDGSLWINLSARCLRWSGLIDCVRQAIAVPAARPAALVLELTETAAQEPADAERTLGQLSALGVGLALDDFGTGFSSLSRLGRLPLDVVKIDKSFLLDDDGGGRSEAIVQSIVDLCDRLSIKAMIEGIETDAHLRKARDLGCGFGQGYHLARPLARPELTNWLAARAA
ncbi:MAG: EAL domain-containing protein [Burkholderiaceae bacterium]